MSANYQRSLLGGGNSPAFSSEDAVRAAGMGIDLSPADVLALKTSVVDRMTQPTQVMLTTLRGEVEARKRAEKRVATLEESMRQKTELFALASSYLQERTALCRITARWKRMAFLSVPVLAGETALILWMSWRLWAR